MGKTVGLVAILVVVMFLGGRGNLRLVGKGSLVVGASVDSGRAEGVVSMEVSVV